MRPLPLLALSCLICACQSAPAVPPPASVVFPAARYDIAMESAAGSLRDFGFRVERYDARTGVVSARPEGLPASAEWWKGNAPNFGDWEARANLQDLRHRVRVMLAPVDAEKKTAYRLTVTAVVERLDTPTKRVTAAWGNPSSNLSEVPEHWRTRGVENNLWQPIGRDAQLERALASDMEKRLQ